MDNLRQLAICSIFNDKKDIDDYRVENAVNIICGKKFYVPEYSDTFSYLFKGMKKYYIDKVIGDNDNDNDDDNDVETTSILRQSKMESLETSKNNSSDEFPVFEKLKMLRVLIQNANLPPEDDQDL